MPQTRLDLAGRVNEFGVTALYPHEDAHKNGTVWVCRDPAGHTINVRASRFKDSRGCRHCAVRIDITGQTFGRLTVHKDPSPQDSGRVECQCLCGAICHPAKGDVVNGITKSCGCLRRETAIEKNKAMVGENHPRWKGGVTRDNRSRHLWRAYGLTLEEVDSKVAEQGGHCELCPADIADGFDVDHDPACPCNFLPGAKQTHGCGKCVRGFLCHKCNIEVAQIERALDLGMHSIADLGSKTEKVLAYLAKYKMVRTQRDNSPREPC